MSTPFIALALLVLAFWSFTSSPGFGMTAGFFGVIMCLVGAYHHGLSTMLTYLTWLIPLVIVPAIGMLIINGAGLGGVGSDAQIHDSARLIMILAVFIAAIVALYLAFHQGSDEINVEYQLRKQWNERR